MPKIDLPVKRLVQRRPADWVKYLRPECREEWIQPWKSEFTPKTESRLDHVFAVAEPGGSYLVNFEPMGYLDPSLPVRMLRYRSDIWEAALSTQREMPPLFQAVFFFYPAHDHGVHRLTESWGELKTLEFTYRVIRVWEQPREPVIARKLVGLYPLLPLMKGEPGEDPKAVLQQSIEVVATIEDPALQQDVLAVMGILAGGKYAPELVYSLIRREMIMQSPIYQDWIKEERAEAEAKGRIEKARDAICRYLNRRFGAPSGDLQRVVQKISDQETLDNLMEELFALNTLDEARKIVRASS